MQLDSWPADILNFVDGLSPPQWLQTIVGKQNMTETVQAKASLLDFPFIFFPYLLMVPSLQPFSVKAARKRTAIKGGHNVLSSRQYETEKWLQVEDNFAICWQRYPLRHFLFKRNARQRISRPGCAQHHLQFPFWLLFVPDMYRNAR